jgi:hypothetical protein
MTTSCEVMNVASSAAAMVLVWSCGEVDGEVEAAEMQCNSCTPHVARVCRVAVGVVGVTVGAEPPPHRPTTESTIHIN